MLKKRPAIPKLSPALLLAAYSVATLAVMLTTTKFPASSGEKQTNKQKRKENENGS
jgi:hypothetical protein